MDRRDNDQRYRKSRAEILHDRRRRRKRTCLIELLIALFFNCDCRCGRYICMEKIWSIESES